MSYSDMLIAILCAVVLALVFILIALQSQIKNMANQVHFIAKNDTNKRVTFYGKMRTMEELAKDINEIIDDYTRRDVDILREDKEIRDTLTNMSHDIRTPLTSLKGYFELLNQTDDPAEQEKYKTIITERIDSLSELLETMFFYTKVSSINYNVELSKINFSTVAMQTLFSYYDDFVANGFEPEVDAQENIMIIGNEQSIKRILQNLIKNVFVHGSGDVKITLSKDDKYASFVIRNGTKEGDIPDPEKVFDRFYKGDKSRHTISNGIGLSVVKKLVDKMNGEITASLEGDQFVINMKLPLLVV